MAAVKTVAVNRKARHEYFVLETLEAGIELVGTEVKSIRQGNVNLKDAWVNIRGGEAYLLGMHISPYEKGNIFNREPLRERKLLLHKREIRKLQAFSEQKGLSLIPLRLYMSPKGLVKVELGVCRGKAQEDKRETIKRREADLEARRAISKHYKG